VAHAIRIRTTQAVQLQGNLELKDQIAKCQELDDEVANAIQEIKSNGPRSLGKGLQEWNYKDGLILFWGKIYVPNNTALRREVVRCCHDPVIMGHPGHFKTLEIVQRNFWWPGMSIFVKSYVDGCAICQETKNITHPTKLPLQPTELADKPFQFITIDFIVKLPESQGFDLILMIVDQHTQTVIAKPCNETFDADTTAELLIKQVFCKHGIPDKIISDWGPQFASKVMRATLRSMEVTSALTTAYHPQADGSTEHVNQEIEQFLRAYYNHTQNNWATLLPYAEMAHNTHKHSATKKTPFELLHGYTPKWPGQMIPDHNVPSLEHRINELQNSRSEAQAALKIAQEAMKIQHDRYGEEGPDWKIGDLVYLDGKNLKVQYPTAKLAQKRQGPLEIIDKIGKTSYKLKTPHHWKIHNVFHGSLLTPYKETEAHGPNHTQPLPTLINNEEEYEVEQIIDIWRFGKKQSWQYFVKWKGYPDSENTWEPLGNLRNLQQLLTQWHDKNPKKPKPLTLVTKLSQLSPQAMSALYAAVNQATEQRRITTTWIPRGRMTNHTEILQRH
jgi:hypothetical protein